MTPEEKSKLEKAGWRVVSDGFWRSPVTQRDLPERAAVALVSIRPRTHSPIYRARFRRATR